MKKQRKHYTAEQKVAILRRRLLDKEPILASICRTRAQLGDVGKED
jgi:hypothetical protein